jgi:hypothetical protein
VEIQAFSFIPATVRLVVRRTSVINQILVFLLERGTVPLARQPASADADILENADEKLSLASRLLDFLRQEWQTLQLQVESLNIELEQPDLTCEAGLPFLKPILKPHLTR